MINTYEVEVTCVCPVDDLPDVYQLTITSRRTIPVEDILAVVAGFREKRMYQEDLCQAIHRRVNASCRVIGYHSGVRVSSQCGEP